MEPFTIHTGRVAPLDRVDVDTDQIVPKRYLKTVHRSGLKEGLFADWRTRPDGSPNPEFFMHQPRYAGATILLTRDNFGCGSSREHAPWALLDYGIRAILAPSFADIFYNNCLHNSLLPIVLKSRDIQRLFDDVQADDPGRRFQMTIDLASQTVSTTQQAVFRFSIDPFHKHCLLQGLDTIGLTLRRHREIAGYEARGARDTPWLFQDLHS